MSWVEEHLGYRLSMVKLQRYTCLPQTTRSDYVTA